MQLREICRGLTAPCNIGLTVAPTQQTLPQFVNSCFRGDFESLQMAGYGLLRRTCRSFGSVKVKSGDPPIVVRPPHERLLVYAYRIASMYVLRSVQMVTVGNTTFAATLQ